MYQRRHPAPAPKPSRARSLVYHPIVVARDPHSTHLMVTRHAAGSPSPWIIYNSPPPPLLRHCLRSRPLSIAHSRTPTGVTLLRRSTRPCCLTARGAWFLDLLGLMSSPASGSSSTSSRWMALLTGTKLVGSFGGSLSAPGWTMMRHSTPSSSLQPSKPC
jgi:hypothetical protein